MAPQFDFPAVLRFLKSLRENNNRDWFNAHRTEFEQAHAQFENYIAALISESSQSEPLAGVTPKDCIFRLNRDLRFTKEKTPYKPYLSAYIAPGGRKSRQLGYYVHIEPGNHSMIAGGLHEPEPRQLAAFRVSIDRDPGRLKKIIADQPFREYFGAVGGDRLKTAPKGYPKDHPDLDLLRLKSVIVTRPISDTEVRSDRFLEETMATFRAMKPFLEYLASLQ